MNYRLLPASESQVLRYVAFLSTEVTPATIKVYMSALANLHIINGVPIEYATPRLQLTLRGIKKSAPPTRQRAPATPAVILALGRVLDLRRYSDLLFWTQMCVAFFGFLRISEFTVSLPLDPEVHLQLRDVAFD